MARQSEWRVVGFAERFAGRVSSAGHSLCTVLASASASRSCSRSAMRLRAEIYCRLMEKWVEWEDTSSHSQGGAGGVAPALAVSFSSVSISVPHSSTGDPHVSSVTSGDARAWAMRLSPPSPRLGTPPVPAAHCTSPRCAGCVPPSSSPAGTDGTTSSNNCFITG